MHANADVASIWENGRPRQPVTINSNPVDRNAYLAEEFSWRDFLNE